jgi:hypothetical protein
MAKLLDQQQLSASVREFEEHLRRVRARDWSVDGQLAKTPDDPPSPARRDANRKAAARDAGGDAPGQGNAQPAGLPIETLESRRLILALAALVLVVFAGSMSFTLSDGGARTAEEGGGAVESDALFADPATSPATQPKTPPVVSATSEVYVAIRPDGSLAPDTKPHATSAPAVVPAPAPDTIAAIITSGEPSAPASSAPAEANAPGENPPAAKPAKKRTGARAVKSASANPAADSEPAATVANPADSGHPAAAAKVVAPKVVAKPVAPKPRAASAAAAKPAGGAERRAPDAEDGGGIFESAKQAVGSLTGAVKKLVGAD